MSWCEKTENGFVCSMGFDDDISDEEFDQFGYIRCSTGVVMVDRRDDHLLIWCSESAEGPLFTVEAGRAIAERINDLCDRIEKKKKRKELRLAKEPRP